MVNEKDLALMDKIMNVFAQKGEWQEIRMNDPRITAAYTRFDAALERIEAEDLHEELYDAYMAGVSAAGDAGILFGIHVAEIIRDVAARPADLSRYVILYNANQELKYFQIGFKTDYCKWNGDILLYYVIP